MMQAFVPDICPNPPSWKVDYLKNSMGFCSINPFNETNDAGFTPDIGSIEKVILCIHSIHRNKSLGGLIPNEQAEE